MATSNESKLALLLCIKKNKDVLFGKHSSTLTNHDKQKAWETVAEEAKVLELLPMEKTWEDAKSKWASWKCRTMKKVDKEKRTGREGTKNRLTDFDKAVLDIVRKESPMVADLPVKDHLADVIESEGSEISGSSMSLCLSPSESENFKIKSVGRSTSDDGDASLVAIKKQKLQLEIDVLDLEKRKKTIEVFALEKKFNLPHCELTTALTK